MYTNEDAYFRYHFDVNNHFFPHRKQNLLEYILSKCFTSEKIEF